MYRNRDDPGGSKQFRSRNYDSSPDEILNGPCHMHYAYVDGKRVSNHLMRDCRTFLKLQEAVGLQQADVQGPIAYGASPPPPLPNQGEAATQRQFNMGSQNIGGYTHSKSYITHSKSYIAAMIRSVPKSKKEQQSIYKQVNLAITSPPTTT
jgi:hypothetical protein